MSDKRERQQLILELVAAQPVASQEELRQLLLQRGHDVTQSTLSRDMKDLRLARLATAQGARYATAEAALHEEGRASIATLLPALFQKLDAGREMIVVRTVIAGAQPIALALDAEQSPDILGTIAGDDTILIICRSEAARERVAKRLLTLARKG